MSTCLEFDDPCPHFECGSASTLKRRLFAMLKEESCTDVELLVTTDNDEIIRIPAHKTILVAMSSVIATKMTRRWEEGGNGKEAIEIPEDVGLEAVEKFLEFLYKEDIKQDLKPEIWLELMFLADHYEVENLMPLCDRNLLDKLNVDTFIEIYEKSRLFQGIECGDIAFNLLKKNLWRMLTPISNELLQIRASTWKIILELDYLSNVEEIELFKGLLRWKDENVEERSSDFQQLIKFIRFPLVGVKNFEEFVVPSGVLDSALVFQLFSYFEGKGPVPERFLNCQNRNFLYPRDSYDLQKFINASNSGDIIELDGTYSRFVIPKNKKDLTIRAKPGKEAFIKANNFGIVVKGQGCKIEGISIIITDNSNESPDPDSYGVKLNNMAKQNVLKNITITGGSNGMIIFGSENSISNITIKDPAFAGFWLGNESSFNEISNCSVLICDNEIEAYGFKIEGKGGNRLNNMICKNVIENELNSSGNVINGLEIWGTFLSSGLTLFSGSNHLENVDIWGENPSLSLTYETENCTIVNCRTDKMRIKGKAHKIVNSKAMEILVAGKRHKFVYCEATEVMKFAYGSEIQSKGCVYQSTQRVYSFA